MPTPDEEPRVDPESFTAVRRELEAAGFVVYVGAEADRYLDLRGAEAGYIAEAGRPGIFHWRERPTRAAVAEEFYHAEQHRARGWAAPDPEEVEQLEAVAQRHLLDHPPPGGWMKSEITATLAYWRGRQRRRR